MILYIDIDYFIVSKRRFIELIRSQPSKSRKQEEEKRKKETLHFSFIARGHFIVIIKHISRRIILNIVSWKHAYISPSQRIVHLNEWYFPFVGFFHRKISPFEIKKRDVPFEKKGNKNRVTNSWQYPGRVTGRIFVARKSPPSYAPTNCEPPSSPLSPPPLPPPWKPNITKRSETKRPARLTSCYRHALALFSTATPKLFSPPLFTSQLSLLRLLRSSLPFFIPHRATHRVDK